MNTLSNLKMPRAVCCGEGALKKMPEILQAASVKKAAVFTDKGIRSAGLLDPVLEQLQKSQAAFCVLDDLPPEPSYGQVQKLVDACRAEGADMILAVGGGSVMDTAKLAGVLLDGSSTVHDLLEAPGRAKKCCPTLMIPTTAGTGSEATPNAIVAVPEQELKVGIVSDAMIADNVLLDPLMIKNLPRKIAAATGVDALAHAIECYTSNKANPISDTFALEALDMILNNILPAARKLLRGRGYHCQRHNGRPCAQLPSGRKISYRPRRIQRHSACACDALQRACLSGTLRRRV